MAGTSAPRVPIPKNGVDYRGKIVLAPMVRSGELPSRLMALKYGADLVWGPETIDRSLIGITVRTNPRTSCVEFSRISSNGGRVIDPNLDPKESIIYRIHPSLESSRLIFQVGTANSSLAVEAAKLVAPYVAGIDVNAGCPKPFSTGGGMGAALLSTPDLLCDILRALIAEVGTKWDIGISVKIRLLHTEPETRALVEKLCATGITGLTVHCRTRQMRKTEKAIREQLKAVGEVCHAAGVACLMNGDVESRAQAEQLVRDFDVDGAMIATSAEKNPSVFRPAADGGIAGWKGLVEEYMNYAIDVENRWGNTKFLLAQMIPGKELVKMGISQAKNYEDVIDRLGLGESAMKPSVQEEKGDEASHQTLKDRAVALDAILGITNNLTKSEQKEMKKRARAENNGPSSANGEAEGSKKKQKKPTLSGRDQHSNGDMATSTTAERQQKEQEENQRRNHLPTPPADTEKGLPTASLDHDMSVAPHVREGQVVSQSTVSV